MHAFDLMAEAKMRQWEKDKKDGKISSTVEKKQTLVGPGESLEKQLFIDIKKLITQSFLVEHDKRKELLVEAEKLQIHLSSRLERSGCYNLAKYFSDEISKLRKSGKL
ncbi:hypothetical protein [Maridesulfovibrio zosterae]|uniref:hypothetical protein n=1 Tax=Maridesulfovibrio zosterae TaxID=82171 RepID=UPI00041A6EEE|nr:hypothetical protein [Maridesulfovibrio zosterae]